MGNADWETIRDTFPHTGSLLMADCISIFYGLFITSSPRKQQQQAVVSLLAVLHNLLKYKNTSTVTNPFYTDYQKQ